MLRIKKTELQKRKVRRTKMRTGRRRRQWNYQFTRRYCRALSDKITQNESLEIGKSYSTTTPFTLSLSPTQEMLLGQKKTTLMGRRGLLTTARSPDADYVGLYCIDYANI